MIISRKLIVLYVKLFPLKNMCWCSVDLTIMQWETYIFLFSLRFHLKFGMSSIPVWSKLLISVNRPIHNRWFWRGEIAWNRICFRIYCKIYSDMIFSISKVILLYPLLLTRVHVCLKSCSFFVPINTPHSNQWFFQQKWTINSWIFRLYLFQVFILFRRNPRIENNPYYGH